MLGKLTCVSRKFRKTRKQECVLRITVCPYSVCNELKSKVCIEILLCLVDWGEREGGGGEYRCAGRFQVKLQQVVLHGMLGGATDVGKKGERKKVVSWPCIL